MNQGSGRQVSFYAPPITFINKVIIILMVSFFLLESILIKSLSRNIMMGTIALSLSGIKSGFINQFFTYPLAGGSFFATLFNGLIIWFIGSDIERITGSKKYLILMGGSVIASAILYTTFAMLISGGGISGYMPLYGMTGICYALLVGYAVFYPDRTLQFMLIFPMKAKYFCLILIGIEAYMGVFSGQGLYSLAHLAGMLFSFIAIRWWQGRLTLGNLKVFSFFGALKEKKRSAAKSHLTLVKGEEDEKSGQSHYWH